MLNETNNEPITQTKPGERFRNYWSKLPMEDANRVRNQICETLDWDRNKWHRMIFDKTAWSTAEIFAVNEITEKQIPW